MKIFIDDDILREMRAVAQVRLFEASATDDASLATGRRKRPAVDRPAVGQPDTAQNGVNLVADVATIYSTYRIKTEMLQRQATPRRRRARVP